MMTILFFFRHDGLGSLASAHSKCIISEARASEKDDRSPSMGDQPVVVPLPTQDNINTEQMQTFMPLE
jgi:hypothetical protein